MGAGIHRFADLSPAISGSQAVQFLALDGETREPKATGGAWEPWALRKVSGSTRVIPSDQLGSSPSRGQDMLSSAPLGIAQNVLGPWESWSEWGVPFFKA